MAAPFDVDIEIEEVRLGAKWNFIERVPTCCLCRKPLTDDCLPCQTGETPPEWGKCIVVENQSPKCHEKHQYHKHCITRYNLARVRQGQNGNNCPKCTGNDSEWILGPQVVNPK